VDPLGGPPRGGLGVVVDVSGAGRAAGREAGRYLVFAGDVLEPRKPYPCDALVGTYDSLDEALAVVRSLPPLFWSEVYDTDAGAVAYRGEVPPLDAEARASPRALSPHELWG
jgi:hypothetical protein